MKRTMILLGAGLALALGAGIAYAATDGTSSGSGWVTQRGTFTVPVGQVDVDVLPLTDIALGGACVTLVPNEVITPRAVLEAGSGETMDVFTGGWTGSSGSGLGISETSVQIGYGNKTTGPGYATEIVIATSNDAIATVTIGAVGNWPSQTCTFMWQALEVPTGASGPPGIAVPVAPGGTLGGQP